MGASWGRRCRVSKTQAVASYNSICRAEARGPGRTRRRAGEEFPEMGPGEYAACVR